MRSVLRKDSGICSMIRRHGKRWVSAAGRLYGTIISRIPDQGSQGAVSGIGRMTELHISTLVLHGVVTFVVALLGTFVMRQTARRCGLLSRPRAERHGIGARRSPWWRGLLFSLLFKRLFSVGLLGGKLLEGMGLDFVSLPSPLLMLGGALVFGRRRRLGLALVG